MGPHVTGLRMKGAVAGRENTQSVEEESSAPGAEVGMGRGAWTQISPAIFFDPHSALKESLELPEAEFLHKQGGVASPVPLAAQTPCPHN